MKLIQWDQVWTTDETNVFCADLALHFARRVNDKELRKLLELKISTLDLAWFCEYELAYSSLSVGDALNTAQVLALFQKRQDIDLQIDKQVVAFKKFMDSERRCAVTNECFRKWSAGLFQYKPAVEAVLYRAQRKIALLLGDVPDVSELRFRFGPGATTQIQKRMASARRKLGETLACSEDFVPVLEQHLQEVPSWIGLTPDLDKVIVSVEIHPGVLSFVPKSAKTDRSIVVEPSLNSFFQQGYGDYIARRLRARGIDITDQTRNQNLAKVGSLYGELATLDLSSASDTIARELVAHLLPVDWFILLDRLRTSTIVNPEGETVKLQKFSSMGNGFTFPLETLIFWALSAAVIDESKGEVVSVYGDDIIVPVHRVPLLTEVLNSCGFVLNKDKSFWSGPFRESCGKDYHSGILIRPVFLKDRLSGESAFILHNFFVRAGDPESAAIILQYIEPELQIFGPDGYGDGHLLTTGDLDYRCFKANHLEHGYCGFTFDTYSWKGRKSFSPLPGDYVYSAYTIYQKEQKPVLSDEDARLLDLLLRNRSLFLRLYGERKALSLLRFFKNLSSDSVPHSKRTGSFGVTLPGTSGYRRISIYTLTV